MKYRTLLIALEELSEDQLDMDVTILDIDSNEVFPVDDTYLASELPKENDISDIVNENQPILVIGEL